MDVIYYETRADSLSKYRYLLTVVDTLCSLKCSLRA